MHKKGLSFFCSGRYEKQSATVYANKYGSYIKAMCYSTPWEFHIRRRPTAFCLFFPLGPILLTVFSMVILFWWQIHSYTSLARMFAEHIAHITTSMVSWHMQNFAVNSLSWIEMQQNYISIRFITVTLIRCHCVSNHRQFDCMFNRLFRQIKKHRIAVFCEWNPLVITDSSLHKGKQ